MGLGLEFWVLRALSTSLLLIVKSLSSHLKTVETSHSGVAPRFTQSRRWRSLIRRARKDAVFTRIRKMDEVRTTLTMIVIE
jgi:hypothetical protein